MHVPNTREWRVNLGLHTLHIGQCIARNILGILHYEHFRAGFSRYGRIYNALCPIFMFSWVMILPAPLSATSEYRMSGRHKMMKIGEKEGVMERTLRSSMNRIMRGQNIPETKGLTLFGIH